MDSILKNILSEALHRYFTRVSQVGYVPEKEIRKLIFLSFIEEMFSSEIGLFITEDDYRKICDALYCLFGSNCMIEFPKYDKDDSLFRKNNFKFKLRSTEDSFIRSTETEDLRKYK